MGRPRASRRGRGGPKKPRGRGSDDNIPEGIVGATEEATPAKRGRGRGAAHVEANTLQRLADKKRMYKVCEVSIYCIQELLQILRHSNIYFMHPQEKIQGVPREVLEELALEFYDSNPARASELVDGTHPEAHQSQHQVAGEAVSWCKCSRCTKMTNQCEDVCCLQTPCISQSPVK